MKFYTAFNLSYISTLPFIARLALLVSIGTLCTPASALDLAPRMWSHLPSGANFLGVARADSDADIAFDPVLQIEDAEMELDTWALKYIHTFEFLEQSARIDITQAYQEGRWTGLLEGQPAATSRKGMSDTFVRLAVNLYGAPSLTGAEFAKYRRKTSSETIVGAGLAVRLPTGDYQKDKLINLGGNRFVFRPQLGIQHTPGSWSAELTAEVALHDENDDFFNGNKLEQEPLYFLHGHIMYSFRPGHWLAVSSGIDHGGESEINGVKKDNRQRNSGWALTYTFPIDRKTGINVSYISAHTHENIGNDIDTLAIAFSRMW